MNWGDGLDSYKVIYVEWVDAKGSIGWEDLPDVIKEDSIDYCKSLGFLIHEDADQIILANSISGKQSNGRIAIPKKWLKKRRVVRCKSIF